MLTLQLLFLTLCSRSTAVHGHYVTHEQRENPPDDALGRRRIERDVVLPMRIGLRQNRDALNQAESWLMEVSDPTSPNYGRHWEQDRVIEAFRPQDETLQTVSRWLTSSGVADWTHSDNRLWLAFDITAEKAEALFQTEYHELLLLGSEGTFEVFCDAYSLPEDVSQHVDYITPGVKGSLYQRSTATTRYRPESLQLEVKDRIAHQVSTYYQNPEDCWTTITPACYQALYNFTPADPSLPVNPNNTMGIFASGYTCKTQLVRSDRDRCSYE